MRMARQLLDEDSTGWEDRAATDSQHVCLVSVTWPGEGEGESPAKQAKLGRGTRQRAKRKMTLSGQGGVGDTAQPPRLQRATKVGTAWSCGHRLVGQRSWEGKSWEL